MTARPVRQGPGAAGTAVGASAGGSAAALRPADLPAMTGLRAVAAGWVVFHHFREPLTALVPALGGFLPLFQTGYLGVELFFVLSGFIISHNYAIRLRRPDRAGYRDFLAARVARVYPVHLFTLAVMGVLVVAAGARSVALTSEYRNTPVNFLLNVVMLQAAPGARPFNWPAWSVSCEFAAYAVFPLLAVVVARISRGAALVTAALISAVGVGGVFVIASWGDFWSLSYAMMWWRIAVGFTTGCFLWAAWRVRGRLFGASDAVVVGAAALTAVFLYFCPPDVPLAFAVMPLLAVVVVGCAGATGWVGRFLSCRPMLWLGRASYSLYMTHFIVFLVLKKLVGWDRFSGTPLLLRLFAAAVLLLTAVAVAGATYHLVEVPSRRRLRSRLRPRRGTPSPAAVV